MGLFRRCILFLLLLVACSMGVFAQQATQYSQYMFSQLAFNPAYAGTNSGVNLEMAVRKQWVGVEGSPFSQHVGGHFKIPLFKSGVGLQIQNENIGAYRDTRVNLAYSYHLEFKNTLLSFGANIGAYQRVLDGSKLITPDGNYGENVFIHNDGLLPHERASVGGVDIGLGVYYKSEHLVAGISVQHLLNNKFNFTDTGALIEESQTYFGFFGYKFDVANNIQIIPSFLLKSDLASFQGELNVLLGFRDLFKAGVTYRGYNKRSTDALVGVFAFNVTSNLQLGYSYDFTLSGLNNFSSGSHEVTLNLKLDKILPSSGGKVVYNTRFL